MSRNKVGSTLRELSRRFPNAFAMEAEGKRPLKRDIFRDLWEAAPDLGYNPLRHALGQYVAGATYLELLRAGAQRFGLYGEPAELVTAHEEEQAREKLARLHEQRGTPKECEAAE